MSYQWIDVVLAPILCNAIHSTEIVVPTVSNIDNIAWWRHQMEIFPALLALCAGNSPVTGEFPAQRPMTRSFDVFFDLRLNKRVSKQSWGWWFETHCAHYDVIVMEQYQTTAKRTTKLLW